MAWASPTSRAQRAQGVDEPLDAEALARVRAVADALAASARAEVESQGVERAAIKLHRRAQLRYAGSDTAIEVEARLGRPPCGAPSRRRTRARFGFIDKAKALVIEAVSAEAVGGAARFSERAPQTRSTPARARRRGDS